MKNTKKRFTEKQAAAAAGRVREWYYSNHTSIADCYGRFSSAKWSAEKYVINQMINKNGVLYRVLSFNCNVFTAAFIYPGIDEKTGAIEPFLQFETAYNTYIYNLYDILECLPGADKNNFELFYSAAKQYLNI